MWDRFKNLFLKAIAITSVYALFFAPAAAGRAVFFQVTEYAMYVPAGITTAFTGFGVSLLITRKRKTWLEMAIAHATVLLPLALIVLTFSADSTSRALYEGACTALFWLIGVRSCFQDYSSIISFGKVFPGMLLNGLTLIVASYFSRYAYLRITVLFSLYIFIGLFVVLLNQYVVEIAIGKKNTNVQVSQRKMRLYNITVVAGLLLLLPILLNIRNILGFIASMVSAVPQGLARLAGKLAAVPLFSRKGRVTPGGEVGRPDGSYPGETGTLEPQIPEAPEEQEQLDLSELIDGFRKDYDEDVLEKIYLAFWIISAILAYAFVLWLVKSGRLKRFVTSVKRAVARGIAIIKYFFKHYFLRFGFREETEDYVDEIEFIIPGKDTGKDDAHGRFKKKLRGLEGLPYGVMAIRRLYGNILKMLISRNIKIVRSDTTGEIFNKSRAVDGISPNFDYITRVYERVRYADLDPGTDEVEKAEGSFKEMTRLLKKKK